ncbi:hypothetical protein BKA67DRAFT_189410 [Truncatella angustata]|uniref:Secreted protein n=1 Tax=Truncatella angustata TaxID=152316 RepID=A0A9P9A0N9_9PEZI|nr:uncharacterized protein BKA67DRAFT_189410 [Truncatella angustata]KAH6657468.1 hypothetical protein BKA67DRAFT_189410 [Truncatella angustata]
MSWQLIIHMTLCGALLFACASPTILELTNVLSAKTRLSETKWVHVNFQLFVKARVLGHRHLSCVSVSSHDAGERMTVDSEVLENANGPFENLHNFQSLHLPPCTCIRNAGHLQWSLALNAKQRFCKTVVKGLSVRIWSSCGEVLMATRPMGIDMIV